jgi:hypothetical protein
MMQMMRRSKPGKYSIQAHAVEGFAPSWFNAHSAAFSWRFTSGLWTTAGLRFPTGTDSVDIPSLL